MADPSIIKVGRNVGVHLRRLPLSRQAEHFNGDLRLSRFAKTRGVVGSSSVGLDSLAAVVLGKCLVRGKPSYPIRVRLGPPHPNPTLDAWASLDIYKKLARMPDTTLPPDPPLGHPVSLLRDDKITIIAHGYVAPRPEPKPADERRISKDRIAITITDVLFPEAVPSPNHKQPLLSFGPCPFQLECARRLLRSRPHSTDPSSGWLPPDVDH